MAAHHLYRVVQHRQVPQAQKVHFQQAQFLQRDHVVLADDGLVVAGQRHIFIHRQAGDDHACGVGGCVAGHALQRLGGVDELLHAGVAVVQVGQLLAELQGVVQCDVQCAGAGWHQLGHHVHLGIGHVQGAAHVPDGAPGGHGAESDDLGHMVVAVLAADVLHHLAPSGIAEVHVDIRHGHALRVQEALEIQLILHRVDIGDMQAVGHHGTCGAASSRANGNARLTGIAHEVRHDKEIVGKAHFLDHVQLVFQLLAVGCLFLAVAALEALGAQLAEIRGGIVAGRQLEFRQMVLAKGEFQLAAVGDTLGVFHRVGIAGEQLLHLLRGTEVEVLGLIAHAVLIVHGLAGLDAQENVMALGVLLPEIVGVVGADQRDTRLVVHPQQGAVNNGLVGNAVILQLQIEVALPQNVPHFQRVGLGPVVIAVDDATGDLTGQTGAETDQTLAVGAEQVKVDTGPDVEALDICLRHHIGQVAVARLVFAQQHHMAGLGIKLMLLVKAGTAGHIHLAADDGVDPLRLAGPVKVDSAVHGAVIRNGAGSLPHLLDQLRQVTDAAGAIQKAILRMDMEVGKGHYRASNSSSMSLSSSTPDTTSRRQCWVTPSSCAVGVPSISFSANKSWQSSFRNRSVNRRWKSCVSWVERFLPSGPFSSVAG